MWGPAMPLARCGVLANSAPATQQHTHTQRGTKGGGGAGDTPQTPRGGAEKSPLLPETAVTQCAR
jgi:hypothetical protein